MRLKLASKLVAIISVCVFVVLLVTGAAMWRSRRVEELQKAQDAGIALLMKSNQVHTRLKNLMVDMFSPQTYGLLKDVVHMPRATRLMRDFEDAVEEFEQAYDDFFESPEVQRLLTDDQLHYQYEIARRIGERSFAGIERLITTLQQMEAEPVGPSHSLYRRIILEHDDDGPTLIQDARSVSYYFSATFERFLQFFITGLNEHSNYLQARTTLIFQLTTVIGIVVSFGLTITFAARLTKRLQYFNQGVNALSRGEFRTGLPEGPSDEVGSLLRSFNLVTRDLATKIDSVSGLLHMVGEQISLSPDVPNLLEVVAEAALRHTHAERVAIFDRAIENRDDPLVFRAEEGCCEDELVVSGATWDAEFPLQTRVYPELVLAVASAKGELSDLDISHIRIFSEYAALLIDHNEVYRELAGRKAAAFEALQAQIQPHFLFNVLGGMFGFNRSGDRGAVETYIIALRHMLRYIVDGPDLTTLGEEMEFSRRYLELQTLRFGDRLKVAVECDEAVETLPIPKLVLQPLVENAVVHGIEPMDRPENPGFVRVRAWCEAGAQCRIEVADNGLGFDPAGLELEQNEDEQSRQAHIGVVNVRRRLAIAHPGTVFRVRSRPGNGTRVTIEIPIGVVEPAGRNL